MTIKKAILPVAGFGTRFLPATKSQPKEMLPVVDKPVIQYLVEEAVESGIEEIIFVTGRGKRAIEDHFDVAYELEHTLEQKGKQEALETIRKISQLAKFSYVRQPYPLGDGHAVLQAAHLINGEPVLVLFGDCIYDFEVPAARQIIEAYEEHRASVIGTSEVSLAEVSQFGVIAGHTVDERTIAVEEIVEKPRPEESPGRNVAVGKYVVTPEIFEILSGMKEGKSGEIRLSDAFNEALERKIPLFARNLAGEWLDTGDKFNFLKATIKLGLKHPQVGEKLRNYIKSLQTD